MKRWKRILFSAISLTWGYVSLDYLYYAYRLVARADQNASAYRLESDGPWQILGVGMFLLWFVILAAYHWLIQKSTFQIDLVEQDEQTGEPRIHRKWFDSLLQYGMILTGAILRWCYLVFILFPRR